MTYKTGSIGEYMRWTKRVIVNPTAATSAPKRWFDSEATAAQALEKSPSVEAMVKLLSAENLALLHLIVSRQPASLIELAMLAGRAASNVSRTLKKLQEAGIVEFEQGAGRTRAPKVVARRVTLELDLIGPDSIVSVERGET